MFEEDLKKMTEQLDKLRLKANPLDLTAQAFIFKAREYIDTMNNLKHARKITKWEFEQLKILHSQLALCWQAASQASDPEIKNLATDIATLTARHCRALDLLHPAFFISKKKDISFDEYLLRLDNFRYVPTSSLIGNKDERCQISIYNGKRTTTNTFLPEASPYYKKAIALHTIAGLLGLSTRVPALVHQDFQGTKGVLVTDITDLKPVSELDPAVKNDLIERLTKISDLSIIAQVSMLNVLAYLIAPLADSVPMSLLVKRYDDGNFAIKGCTWENHGSGQAPQTIKPQHFAFLPSQLAAVIKTATPEDLAYRLLGLGFSPEELQELQAHYNNLKTDIWKNAGIVRFYDKDFAVSRALICNRLRQAEKDSELSKNNLFLRLCADVGVDFRRMMRTVFEQKPAFSHPRNQNHPVPFYSSPVQKAFPFVPPSNFFPDPKNNIEPPVNTGQNTPQKLSLSLSKVCSFYPRDYPRKQQHNEPGDHKQASFQINTVQPTDESLGNGNSISIGNEPRPGANAQLNTNNNPYGQISGIANYYSGYCNQTQFFPYVSPNSGNYVKKSQFFSGYQ